MSKPIVSRCYCCRHSIDNDGNRLSFAPLSDLAWDNIACEFDISDGLCSLCYGAESERVSQEVARIQHEIRAGLVGALAIATI